LTNWFIQGVIVSWAIYDFEAPIILFLAGASPTPGSLNKLAVSAKTGPSFDQPFVVCGANSWTLMDLLCRC
jgi:hypothetical protein